MYTQSLLRTLVLALSATSVARANFLDVLRVRDPGTHLIRRQGSGSISVGVGGGSKGDSDADTTTEAAATPTASPTDKADPTTKATPTPDPTTTKKAADNNTPTPTPAKTTKTTPTAIATQKQDPTTNAAPDPTTSPDDTTQPSKTADAGGDTTQAAQASTTAQPTTQTSTKIITKTNADGSKETSTQVSVSTHTPGLSSAEQDSESTSGMDPNTKKTVIGVVVGIGGAIVLGALGIVAYRIWGRRRNTEESDGLMSYGTPGPEKSEAGGSMGGRSPFQSTLESYHAPTQVNGATNF